MSASSSKEFGHDRRKKTEPIHPWRWRGLIVWIVLFTAINFFAIRSIESQSAKVIQLQKTNCGLEKFLLTARKARWESYLKDSDNSDLQAVVGYEQLLEPFTANRNAVGYCPIPLRLIIKKRPLRI